MIDQVSAVLWRFHHHAIDARRLPALIHLRHTPHTDQRVGVATQHEPLEGADRIPVARLRRPEDALPQIADLPISFAPVDALPVGQPRGSDCSVADVLLRRRRASIFPRDMRSSPRSSGGLPSPRQHPFRSSIALAGEVWLSRAFRQPAFAFWTLLLLLRMYPASRWGDWPWIPEGIEPDLSSQTS